MKELRFRLILILAAIALCVYLLYPTYEDYRNSKEISQILEKKREEIKSANPDITNDQLEQRLNWVEDSIKAADPSIVKARQERIKLGLDLQGGMRVVLEVNTSKLLEKIARNPDETFKQVLDEATKEAAESDESIVDLVGNKFEERGIRLSRYFGTVREEDSEILD